MKCPYCAEDIKDEAVKCRYCGEFLDAVPTSEKEASEFDNALRNTTQTVTERNPLANKFLAEERANDLFQTNQTCWYCKSKEGKKELAVQVDMYGNVSAEGFSREGLDIHFKQTYYTVKIPVPRCQECCNKHNNHGMIGCITVIVSGLAGGALFLTQINASPFPVSLVGAGVFFIFGALAGFVLGAILKAVFKPNIPIENDNGEYGPIKHLRTLGWKRGEKPMQHEMGD